jgi:catechol 2,3-dioxygenase-like lactoylglutathione lyase family enzyme
MFGRFLEISVASADIAASVQFYERLGFTQLTANDTWAHPYGVLTDGRVCIGLHQRGAGTPSPLLTFVQPDLAQHVAPLRARGFEAETAQLGEAAFHQLQLRDPAGQAIALLEARTFSPALRQQRESLCGWFSAYSMPALGNEAVREFWERVGFVALDAQDQPLPSLPLVSDHLSLALHAPRALAAPLLLFVDPAMGEKLALLEAAGIERSAELPRGLDRRDNALLEAPEGTLLLLLSAEP